MRIYSILCLVGLLAILPPLKGQSGEQQKDPVLFTYGSHEVTRSEFKYVFEKNNPEIESPTVTDLKDYLDLYKKFKVKVAAAESARIDTAPSVRSDLKNYLDQLYNSYLDKVVLDPLMDEVKERWQTDVRAKHILVNLPKDASPEDSAEAYERIMEIRERLINGEDFDKVALETSDDKYVKNNKGDLGYINALMLPYHEFENQLYSTEVGEISDPVRTRLGYHVIMPTEKRKAMGTVEVAHILVQVPPNASAKQAAAAKDTIDMIYQKLKDGKDFGKLARQYSDDQQSKTKGGMMQPFTVGNMVAPFEKAAFSLEGDSSFTKPFRSRYGYHILMLLDKEPKESFEESRGSIQRKVKKDERYKAAIEEKVAEFKKQYGFEKEEIDFAKIVVHIDSGVYTNQYVAPILDQGANQELFSVGNATYTANDLLQHIERNQRYNKRKNFSEIVQESYNAFEMRMVMETAFRDRYPDYTKLKKEYKDGIMMFAMMQDSVWNRAMRDTTGLEAYYEQHKGEYMWGKRADATIFYINDPEAVNLKRLKRRAKRQTREELYKTYNDSTFMTVQMDSFLVERGVNDLVDTVKWQKGWSQRLPNPKVEEGYAVVKINEVRAPEPKTLAEARGSYIADYQTKLEKEWVATLLERYPVKVNEKVLRSLAE